MANAPPRRRGVGGAGTGGTRAASRSNRPRWADSAWLDALSAALRGDGVGLAAAAGGWLALTAEREGCLIPAKGGAGMDVPLGGAILGRREVIRAALEAAAEENDP
ncbi:MAG TPA: hypothetical protein PLD47_18395, partial [Aggregatilineales bacterium]|nr:hypothetical protein [Aggregatilineales bacterium]